MITLQASLPGFAVRQAAAAGSVEANYHLFKVVGPVRLLVGDEEIYHAKRASVPTVIIELANCIWRCCSQGLATTLSMMLEPVVDFIPEGDSNVIIDTGQGNEVLVRIPNESLLDYRKTILIKAQTENPGLFELMVPLLFGPVPKVSE